MPYKSRYRSQYRGSYPGGAAKVYAVQTNGSNNLLEFDPALPNQPKVADWEVYADVAILPGSGSTFFFCLSNRSTTGPILGWQYVHSTNRLLMYHRDDSFVIHYDLTVAAARNTYYKLAIRHNSGAIEYLIDDVVVGTSSGDMSNTTVKLAGIGALVRTGIASYQAVQVSRVVADGLTWQFEEGSVSPTQDNTDTFDVAFTGAAVVEKT